jgi:hypothetical protein
MKNEFFSKILKKPLLLLFYVSLWPLLTYVVPAIIVPYLQLFYIVHFILAINYIRLVIIYLRFKKFPTYEEARTYFYDLKRVKSLEIKAKRIANKKAKEEHQIKIKREAEEKIKKEEQVKLETFKRMKLELEERKKKVL